jgi:hypothetical protein
VTQGEFNALIADSTKRIEGGIAWTQDKNGVVFEFRIRVLSDPGDQLSVKGSHNRKLGKTSYTLYTTDRIFSVDFDRRHGDAGNFHIHVWDAAKQKCVAAKVDDSAEIGKDPLRLWKWFCDKTQIVHNGALQALPPIQGDLRFGQ